MQAKHLIIFALAGIAILIAFNLFSSNQHEQNRAGAIENNAAQPPVIAESYVDDSADGNAANLDPDIANKPLGQQPKAILDKAATNIEQAQQVDQQRLDQQLASQ